MEEIGVAISPKQISKLRNGHAIIVKQGSQTLHLGGHKVKKMRAKFSKGQGITIKLDPEEVDANQMICGGKIRADKISGAPRRRRAQSASDEEDEGPAMEDADGMGTISVRDIMGGKVAAVEGGKLNLGKVYRKKIRPIATKAIKKALPFAKAAAKTAITAALVNRGVPPAAADAMAGVATEVGTKGLTDVANRAGVTEGLGIRRAMPVRRAIHGSTALMGAGIDPLSANKEDMIPSQMRSKPRAAANQMNLQQTRPRGIDSSSPAVHALPVQMQSNLFTGMNLNTAVARSAGSGLYPAGMHASRTGRGLFL